ncbi:cytochrome P450 [Angustibacter sp. McL0619]|uniref:cytochrome P450 n=1 Tax=Angustibacter sp. McL0619 TaxID=3415676 RepID=UPI003CF5BD39
MTSRLSSGFDPTVFNLNNQTLIDDPLPAYAWMREHRPIFFSPVFAGSWSFFRYHDVQALLRSDDLTTYRPSLPLEALPAADREPFMAMVEVIKYWMAFYDGGEHAIRRHHLRRIWEGFSPPDLRSRVSGAIDDVLAEIDPAADEIDLVTQFARPLPARVIADLVGVPAQDHARLASWADPVAYLFGSSEIVAADAAAANWAVKQFVTYFRERRTEALAAGAPTMLHQLCTVQTDGYQFTEIDVYAQCILLMFAGITPCRHIITNSVNALARHPAEQQRLRQDPGLMESALEELLRYDTPVQFIGRRAKNDFSYSGQQIRRGQPVLLYAGSGNHDTDVFEQPEELRLARTPNRHLSFGFGRHFCVGADLVRLQTRLALEALLARVPAFRLADVQRAQRTTFLGFHGFASLPVSTAAEGG